MCNLNGSQLRVELCMKWNYTVFQRFPHHTFKSSVFDTVVKHRWETSTWQTAAVVLRFQRWESDCTDVVDNTALCTVSTLQSASDVAKTEAPNTKTNTWTFKTKTSTFESRDVSRPRLKSWELHHYMILHVTCLVHTTSEWRRLTLVDSVWMHCVSWSRSATSTATEKCCWTMYLTEFPQWNEYFLRTLGWMSMSHKMSNVWRIVLTNTSEVIARMCTRSRYKIPQFLHHRTAECLFRISKCRHTSPHGISNSNTV